MGVSLPHCRRTKKSGEHVQDQDSSSTQSDGQSHSEMASLKEGNPCGLGVVSGPYTHLSYALFPFLSFASYLYKKILILDAFLDVLSIISGIFFI